MIRIPSVRWLFLAGCGVLAVLPVIQGGDEKGAASSNPQSAIRNSHSLTLHARKRVETKPGTGRYHTLTESVTWDPKKTALVICDMWNQHWCDAATRRVAEMAPRMNEVVAAARERGVLIIHCPSGTLDFYKDTPQRKLAQSAPPVEVKRALERWCSLDAGREGKLPIDDSDGGCQSGPQPKDFKGWTRQIATIDIKDGDAITDSAEAYYLMKQRGIENLLVMGVHTNMCVLGRPFSIRQMVYQGINVVLVRDMTDTMYNPAMAPFVHHCTGTDLVVEHIEKHWCPTITSADIIGGKEFRFAEDKRPHVVFLVADDEYKTELSLPEFAAKQLGKEFRTTFVHGSETERNDMPGIDVVKDADVLFVSARRRALPEQQLALVRDFVAAGKPLIGIRTASHAFSLRKETDVPAGHAAWQTFDPDVLGGHYTGHYGSGPKVATTIASTAANHPILEGVDVTQLIGNGSLYKVSPLADTARPLVIGATSEHPPEPVAWINAPSTGGKVFYTSLGQIDDFNEPAFNRLLVNAVRWATTK